MDGDIRNIVDNVMEVDDSGRENIVDNTYNGNNSEKTIREYING